MRSRGRIHVAWILNTKPVKADSVGCTITHIGGGAQRRGPNPPGRADSRTPEIFTPEPKNTGDAGPEKLLQVERPARAHDQLGLVAMVCISLGACAASRSICAPF